MLEVRSTIFAGGADDVVAVGFVPAVMLFPVVPEAVALLAAAELDAAALDALVLDAVVLDAALLGAPVLPAATAMDVGGVSLAVRASILAGTLVSFKLVTDHLPLFIKPTAKALLEDTST